MSGLVRATCARVGAHELCTTLPQCRQADRAEAVKAAAWDLFTELFQPAAGGIAAWTVPVMVAAQLPGLGAV